MFFENKRSRAFIVVVESGTLVFIRFQNKIIPGCWYVINNTGYVYLMLNSVPKLIPAMAPLEIIGVAAPARRFAISIDYYADKRNDRQKLN